MLEALCSIGFLSGFIQFLKVAVFAVGYISGSSTKGEKRRTCRR